MNKYILIILTIAICPIWINAQYTLSGTVTSEIENTPIASAEIFDHQTKEIIIPNQNGHFNIDNLAVGKYILTIYALDYESLTTEIIINNHTVQNFELKKLSIELSGIEIAARREELFEIKQLNDIEGTSLFAGKKSEVVVMDLVNANLASNNGRQVYAQVAGLNIYEADDGGLQLNIGGRGLDPNRTSNFNTRQNGYDISADVLGYPENYYAPPTEAISEVRIVRGASSLQYGTQFGGLVDFQIRKSPLFKKWDMRINQSINSFGDYNSFVSVGYNSKKWSINAFSNYKNGQGFRSNSAYESNNFFGAMDYRLSENTHLTFEFTYFEYLAQQAGGLTDQQFAISPTLSTRDRNWFAVDWKLYNFKFNHTFTPNMTASLSLFGLDASRNSIGFRGNPININENPLTSIDEKDVNGQYIHPRDLILGKFSNYGAEFRLLNKFNISNIKSVLLLGSKYYNSTNSSIQGAGSTLADADFDLYNSTYTDYPNQSDFTFPNRNISVFAENIIYLTDHFSITPGVRLEYIKTESTGSYRQIIYDNAGNPIANNVLTDNKILTRKFALLGIGISYKKSKKLQLTANLSQNYRSVTFSDIRVVNPTFVVDPNIKDESGLTADLGIRGRLDKYLSYDFNIYSILYDDRIGIVLDDRANRVRKNIGKAIIAGSESLINVNIARLISPDQRDFKLSSFINLAYTYSQYIESQENNVVGKKVEFIPEINLKSGISTGYKKVNASIQVSYLTKQYTDVQNSSAANAGDIRSGVVGEIPAYTIFDLNLGYKWTKFYIQTGINNLLNESYFTRRATGYPGPGIIPSSPRSFFMTLSYKI